MNKTDQMSFFGFEAEPNAAKPSVTPKPVKVKVPSAAPTPAGTEPQRPEAAPTEVAAFVDAPLLVQPQAAQATDPEAMAQTLAQHPDFRVLRRLVPHSDYGPVNGQATQRVIVLDTET
ncbi:MAG: polymerase PolC-type, partial [Pseudomonadota bacterium]